LSDRGWDGGGSDGDHPAGEAGRDLGGEVAAVEAGEVAPAVRIVHRQDDLVRTRIGEQAGPPLRVGGFDLTFITLADFRVEGGAG
jgi:hypothetical protein